MGFSMAFISPSRQILGFYLTLWHDLSSSSLSNPFVCTRPSLILCITQTTEKALSNNNFSKSRTVHYPPYIAIHGSKETSRSSSFSLSYPGISSWEPRNGNRRSFLRNSYRGYPSTLPKKCHPLCSSLFKIHPPIQPFYLHYELRTETLLKFNRSSNKFILKSTQKLY
jgi:hypothetical protein